MSTRPDSALERVFRWIITIIAVILWLSLGYAVWMALLARVGIVYCTALFVRIVDGKSTEDLATQMDYALHFYVDGLLRYLEATRPNRPIEWNTPPPVQKGRFKFEAYYSLTFFLMWFVLFPVVRPLLSGFSNWMGSRVSLRFFSTSVIIVVCVSILWALWIGLEKFNKGPDDDQKA